MEKKWWKESVIYQIYPKSFCDSNHDGMGDILGIVSKLDYLKDLGVDILWISPMYVSPQVDNGYDIADYYNIDPMFGTNEDFDILLKEAHARGLKIVMDLVVNHTSIEHPWFKESRRSKDNQYRDYYIWKDKPTNWASIFAGSAWEYDENTDMYYLHLYAKEQADLNWENVDMRNDIYKMMRYWLDKGIDGFRMDVINKISKDQRFLDIEPQTSKYMRCSKYTSNGPRIHEFLQEMNQNVMSQYDMMTVGEITACSIEDAIQYTSDHTHELNMLFQFEHTDVDAGQYGKWTPVPLYLPKLKASLEKWQLGLMNEGWNNLFWDNHDQPRVVSRFGNTEYWADSAKMLAATLHMMKGTPYIYQGEELGMTNYPFSSLNECVDVEVFNNYKELVEEKQVLTHEEMMNGIRYSSRDNARTPMQWDESENAGFSSVTPWMKVNPNYENINANKQIGDEDSVYSFYQKLIKLRHHNQTIVYGDFELLEKEDLDLFIYRRYDEDNEILVISNFSTNVREYKVEGDYEILISNDEQEIHDTVSIKPYGTYVLIKK